MAPTSSSVRPYCGREPYIFISYAHRNETEVYRIIERMQAEGYRIWYDRGIDPGTEWADNIAERVASCDYFIAFITKEYLKSTNCLDELSFARDKEKKRLLVYLSNVTLPDGISMRSNRLQAIHKYAYAQEEEFYEKLFRAKGIDSSRAASSDRPESAVAPYVEESPRESEERISAPLPGAMSGTARGENAACGTALSGSTGCCGAFCGSAVEAQAVFTSCGGSMHRSVSDLLRPV